MNIMEKFWLSLIVTSAILFLLSILMQSETGKFVFVFSFTSLFWLFFSYATFDFTAWDDKE